MPFITGGGGFALGLLSIFGIKDLLPTQHALALTVFGLVTCLILVIAIATMDMKEIKRKDGSTLPIGSLASGIMAVVMLLIGIGGASMFIGDYWVHNMIRTVQIPAFYSYNPPDSDGKSTGPMLLVGASHYNLKSIDEPATVDIPINTMLDVRIPTVLEQQDAQRAITTHLAEGAGPAS